jgi:HK97 family phage major capsid protein
VATNAHPIAFGDFSRAYLLVDRVGLRITVDANITTPGRIKYFIRRREGGIVLNNDAIKFLKAAAS